MNLVLLQLKTDYRRFRWWLVAFWILLVIFSVFRPYFHVLQADPVTRIGQIINSSLPGYIYILGVLICVRLIQSDPLVETNAFWMGRPIRRGHLMTAKTLFVVLFCLLPCLVAWNISWWLGLNLVFKEWLQCLRDFTFMFLLYALFPMVLAAMTPKFSYFIIHVGVFFVTLVGAAVIWEYLAGGNHFTSVLQQERETRDYWLNVMMGCCVVLAWLAQFRRNGRMLAYIIWGVSLILLPLLQKITPYEMLPFKPEPIPNASCVSVQVLTNNQVVPFDHLVVGTHIGVTGVKSNQVAIADSFIGDFYYDQYKNGESPVIKCIAGGNGAQVREGWYMKIQSSLPSNVVWFSKLNSHSTKLFTMVTNLPPQALEGDKGRFTGEMDLKIYNIDKVADVPITTKSFITSDGRRYWIEMTMVDDVGITFYMKVQSYPAFMSQGVDQNDKQHCYVLYNPELSEAIFCLVPEEKTRVVVNGGVTYIRCVTFNYPILRSKLVGGSFEKWLEGTRLLAYRVEIDSKLHQNFKVNNYVFEMDRSHHWNKNTKGKR